ncbi:MAG: GNAT family N-acetyltransferase [Paracoccus sp.]|nr:GNAT family N-acetyltransferase [Paracoccus sp. (in: a-proteobacteria)]
MQILHPIPAPLLPAAAALWRAHFGRGGWPQRVHAGHGLVAVDAAGAVVGVMGLRDAAGGFADGGAGWPGWLFRAAPATGDLVIDGLAVCLPRQGVGRALVDHARHLAQGAARPGLRAEVRARNQGALAFYADIGFEAQAVGRYGLPWWGQVHVLRLAA